MKDILCLAVAFAGLAMGVHAQNALPSSGPSYSKEDTTTAAVISIASMQAFPVSLDHQGIEKVEEQATTTIIASEQQITEPNDGPIRDWSNPSGYLGSSGAKKSMRKHKPLKTKKYQRKKKYRCYVF